VTLHVQFLTMGLMLASGLVLGAVFDFYRVLAGELRVPRWLIPLFDLAYWGFSTVFVFKVLLYSNYGQVRLFVFIGLFAGLALYFIALGRTVIRVIKWLIGLVKKLLWLLKRTVEVVLIGPILFLYKCFTILLGFLAALAIFLYKFVLQLLYPLRLLGRFCYRLLKPYLRWPKWLKAGWTWLTSWLRR